MCHRKHVLVCHRRHIVTKRNFNSCSGNNTSSVSDDKNTWHRLHDRLLKAPCVTDRYWPIPLNFIQIALKPHPGPVFQLLTIRKKTKIDISLRGTKNPKFEKKSGESTGNQLKFSNFNFYKNRFRISKVRADSSWGDPCQKKHRFLYH